MPDPKNPIGKLASTPIQQDIVCFAMDLEELADFLMARDEAPDHGCFQSLVMELPSKRSLGGTNQIMHNIIAERVLRHTAGIPPEQGIPSNEIPTSGTTL